MKMMIVSPLLTTADDESYHHHNKVQRSHQKQTTHNNNNNNNKQQQQHHHHHYYCYPFLSSCHHRKFLSTLSLLFVVLFLFLILFSVPEFTVGFSPYVGKKGSCTTTTTTFQKQQQVQIPRFSSVLSDSFSSDNSVEQQTATTISTTTTTTSAVSNNNANIDSSNTVLFTLPDIPSLDNPKYDYLTIVREHLNEVGCMTEWIESMKMISELLLDMETTETTEQRELLLLRLEDCLANALNWKRFVLIKSKIARKYIETIVPNHVTIQQSIQYLQKEPSLSLSNETILKGIFIRPEIYLLKPQMSYEQVFKVIPTKYLQSSNKKDDTTTIQERQQQLRDLIIKDPSILGNIYNCADTGCNSNCDSCWVSYPLKLSKLKNKESTFEF